MSDRLPDRIPPSSPPAVIRRGAPPLALAAVVGVLVGVISGGAAGVLAAILAFVVGMALVGLAGVRSTGGRPRERIDPFALSEPWRQFVRAALQAQARYDRTVSQAQPGPRRDRLADIGRRIDECVRECWQVARRGDELAEAIKALDVPGTRRRLEALGGTAEGDAGPSAGDVVAALQARLDTADRMRGVVDDASDRLRLLDARLGEAVARGVELSVRGDEGLEAAGLGADVDDLVLQLSALRAALDETGRPGLDPGTGTGTGV